MATLTDKTSGDDMDASGRIAAGVVVLGSGRSGTSAITRAFIASGFFAGGEDKLYGADVGNPLGHYEALSVLELNKKILSDFGCNWWADAPTAEEQLSRRTELTPRLKAVLDELIASTDGAPAVLKEPRINGLLPLWQPVLEGVLHPVLAVRDPLEIALSHSRRDGTSLSHALASWECQTRLVLKSLHGRTVTVAPYADLMAQSELAAALVRDAALHLEQARARHVRPDDANSALDPKMYNEKAATLVRNDCLTVSQTMLWQYLKDLPLGDTLIEATPADLRRSSSASQAATRKESERVQLLEAHAALVKKISEAMTSVSTLERRLAEERSVAQREAALAERQASELASVHRSASWQITAPFRRLKRILGRHPKG